MFTTVGHLLDDAVLVALALALLILAIGLFRWLVWGAGWLVFGLPRRWK